MMSDVSGSTFHGGSHENPTYHHPLNSEETNPQWVYANQGGYMDEQPTNYTPPQSTPQEAALSEIRKYCDSLLSLTYDPSTILDFNPECYGHIMNTANVLLRSIDLLQELSQQGGPPSMAPRPPNQPPTQNMGIRGSMDRTPSGYQPSGFNPASSNIPMPRPQSSFEYSGQSVMHENRTNPGYRQSQEDVKPSPNNMMSSFSTNKGYEVIWDGKNGNPQDKGRRKTRKRKAMD